MYLILSYHQCLGCPREIFLSGFPTKTPHAYFLSTIIDRFLSGPIFRDLAIRKFGEEKRYGKLLINRSQSYGGKEIFTSEDVI
jgi:hypothetical protein